MRRLAIILTLIALAGCGRVTAPAPPAVPSEQPPAPVRPTAPVPGAGAEPAPAAPADPRPNLLDRWSGTLPRDEVRQGLDRLMNTGDEPPADKLKRFVDSARLSDTGVPWVEADLDGDGSPEYALALPVTDPGATQPGAALFVIDRQGGRFAVDVNGRMSDRMEVWLMAPYLHGAVDLAGTGRPQILWSRSMSIATGPQPVYVFATDWKPGAFTNLPGEMVISSTPKERGKVAIDGHDIVLTGGSRGAMFLPPRVDRYRFVDGAFRLVDRRFTESDDDAYSRFWDGLVAEDVGRLADAEQAYRAAIEPARKPHPGLVPQYHNFPVQLSDAEVAAFGEALRALARFRLGALLLSADRPKDAADVLRQAAGPYRGLAELLLHAGDREAGCRGAAAWAAADPQFLPALNRGVADAPWTPELLCSHERLDDRVP